MLHDKAMADAYFHGPAKDGGALAGWLQRPDEAGHIGRRNGAWPPASLG